MKKIIIILCAALVLLGAWLLFRPEKQSETKIFEAERTSFFEGMSIMKFVFAYGDGITVASLPHENPTELIHRDGFKLTILTTFEDGRGYSPIDYVQYELPKVCPACKEIEER